ncbi:MAG: YihY/virulence factor BrkB family protein [Desulfobaccales bacterium]
MAIRNSRLHLTTWPARVAVFWREGLWQKKAEGLKGLGLNSLRILVLSVRGLLVNRSLIRASALAYLTALAVIPLLALLFAILKSLGIQRLLAATLLEHLAPGSKDFAFQILYYIENTQVASLGVFGIVALLADLIILMTNVERAFNNTWQVGRTRPWRRKLSDYISIFLIFPLMLAVAVSITTNFLTHPSILPLLGKVVPPAFLTSTSGLVSLLLFWMAFTFIYLVMPNTRVNFFSALLGGLVGASLWELAQMLLAWFHTQASYYNAIYGVVYHLLFFTLWMYWSWLIVLFGTEVAYSHQHLEQLTEQRLRPPAGGESVDEYVALAALVAIAGRFARRQPPLTLEELSRTLADGGVMASRVLQTLKKLNLVWEVLAAPLDGPPGYVPAMPLDQVTVGSILSQLRQARLGRLAQAVAGEPGLTTLIRRLAEGSESSPLDGLSLGDLVSQIFPRCNGAADQAGRPLP